MTKTFVTLQSQPIDGVVYWKVMPTKFDREPGDAMQVEGVNYTVLTVGDREACIVTMNFARERALINLKRGFITKIPVGKFNERAIIK
jgi:hypothetical protein